jgi:hypothetical protein
LSRYPSLLQDAGKFYELTWWYLYLQVLDAEARKRKELSELIEALLPWINPELWAESRKKGQDRVNVEFENQLRAMLDGTWNTDPDATQTPFIDELSVGSASASTEQQPSIAQRLFEQFGGQAPSSIRDQIFPGVPPSFRGTIEEAPNEVRNILNQQFGTQSSVKEEK